MRSILLYFLAVHAVSHAVHTTCAGEQHAGDVSLLQASVQSISNTSTPEYFIVKTEAYPDIFCSNFRSIPQGWTESPENCGKKTLESGMYVFDWIHTGRHMGECFSEGIDVTETLWDEWMADLGTGAVPRCPGGNWEMDAQGHVYAFAPPSRNNALTTVPPPTVPTMTPPTTTVIMTVTIATIPPTTTLPPPPGPVLPSVQATGDPHLVNVLGQHFDIYRSGVHTLLEIPRGVEKAASLLFVESLVSRLGGTCADMYFQTVNISGQWAALHSQTHGVISYSAHKHRRVQWEHFGRVDIKVAQGHTPEGLEYLNFFVRNLKHTGYAVGGLLGEDDHTVAATPSAKCKKTIAL